MCQRLVSAYQKQQQPPPPPLQSENNNNSSNDNGVPTAGTATTTEKDLAFLQFFATPIENLDEMAAAVIVQEDPDVRYEDIVEHVRLLQEYEVLFWDGCYNAK